MNDSLVQAGGAVALAALVIREVFSYLKTRNGNNGNHLATNAVLSELQKMNSNHLSHIQDAIEIGNKAMINAFNAHAQNEHNDSILIVQALGKIEGLLQK